MINCSWKEHWGIDCLTCGFQRSFLQLIEGNFIKSIETFPATIPFLLTIVLLGLHLWRKYKNGSNAIVVMFSLTSVLIVANYIVKLSNGTAFQ